MTRSLDKETAAENKKFELKTRICLMCRNVFESEWSGERICRKCKSTERWRQGE